MGRAVDELGQDESRVARRIADAVEGYTQAEASLNELAQPLVAAIHELALQRGGGRFAMNTALAERLRQTGDRLPFGWRRRLSFPRCEQGFIRRNASERTWFSGRSVEGALGYRVRRGRERPAAGPTTGGRARDRTLTPGAGHSGCRRARCARPERVALGARCVVYRTLARSGERPVHPSQAWAS